MQVSIVSGEGIECNSGKWIVYRVDQKGWNSMDKIHWKKLRGLVVVVVAAGTMAAFTAVGEEASGSNESVAQGSKMRSFMRKKLVASEQILEGLTVPDPALVRKGATSMIHMSKAAMWTSHGSPSYAQDSSDFVRTAERLIKLMNADDLEGASHTYAQLTIQCVNCHRRVRSQKVAALIVPVRR